MTKRATRTATPVDWLKPHCEGFLKSLGDQGYSAGTLRTHGGVASLFCQEVILAETEQGRGVLGVIDGSSPKGIESTNDREWRHGLLRKIGYKR